MATLRLHSVFHLNLLFSSIPEQERKTVVERCYWPLLRLIRDTGTKIAVEAIGYTLEEVARIDPTWIAELRSLVAEGKTEIIGSGYAQVVGPLVPAEVTLHNLAIGRGIYESLLGVRPVIAYINEQTYSAGLVPLYKDAGYEALVMEWNNAADAHPEWDAEWRYQLVRAQGSEGTALPLLWNDSLVFQSFQRYAHEETELSEYLEGVLRHVGTSSRTLMLYGNDAEIFDFRPGRFRTEAMLDGLREWKRIEAAYRALSEDPRVSFHLPSEVLREGLLAPAVPTVALESPVQPIPVKKQEKYNLARWALTGRDSIGSNTRCYRIYEALMQRKDTESEELWKRLCYAWDSDFRTHITEERFAGYQEFLRTLEKDAGAVREPAAPVLLSEKGETPVIERRCFSIDLPRIKARINVRRGLALDSLTFSQVSDTPLIGTLAQGRFDRVPLNADFYSGNTVIDVPGIERVTDLEHAEDVRIERSEGRVVVTGRVPLGAGYAHKRITFDDVDGSVLLESDFFVEQATPAVFHTGLLSFSPEAFDRASLFYASTNGGREEEVFLLGQTSEVRSDPVSLLVSSRTALGNTTGVLRIGDRDRSVILETDMSQLASLPIVAFVDTGASYFLRAAYSLSEFDDTTRLSRGRILPSFSFRMRIRARKEA